MARRAITAVIMAVFAVVTSAAPAGANLDCTGTSALCPEGASQRYWLDPSVTGGWSTAVTGDISHDLTPTDLITQIVSSHADSDVAIQIVNTSLGTNIYGVFSCPDPAGGICRHWHIKLTTYDNAGDNEATPYGAAHRDWISCLELGHTSGLNHNPNNNPSDPSCMYNSNLLHNRHLNTHDHNHIDAIV